MNEVDLLSNVIAFCIGLAGFSGVVAAVTRQERWGALDRFRLVNLLIGSLGPAIISFFSLGFIDHQWGWKIASGGLGLFTIGFCVFVVLSFRRLPDKDRALIKPGALMFLQCMLVCIGLIQVAGVFGVLGQKTFLTFYFGLVVTMVVAVVLFAIAVLAAASSTSRVNN